MQAQVSGSSETGRLETFSDGVFAIAITLLVIEIKVPASEVVERLGGVVPAVASLWPSYLGYVISFWTLGIMWANHHAIFQYIQRVDRYFLVVHVVFLMAIAFVPFPTAVLAEYLPDAAHRLGATQFYSAAFVVIALCWNAVWWYAVWYRLLAAGADAAAVRTISRRYAIGPLAYGLSLVLAFFNAWASLAVHALLAAYYLRPEHRRFRAARGSGDGSS